MVKTYGPSFGPLKKNSHLIFKSVYFIRKCQSFALKSAQNVLERIHRVAFENLLVLSFLLFPFHRISKWESCTEIV